MIGVAGVLRQLLFFSSRPFVALRGEPFSSAGPLQLTVPTERVPPLDPSERVPRGRWESGPGRLSAPRCGRGGRRPARTPAPRPPAAASRPPAWRSARRGRTRRSSMPTASRAMRAASSSRSSAGADGLADRLGRDAVLGVVARAAISRRRLVSSIARCIDGVTVSAYRMTSALTLRARPADGLDQRGLAPQEALLVGVEDRHQRHLRQVQPLAQQVHADQHVELARGAGRAGSPPARASRSRCAGTGRAGPPAGCTRDRSSASRLVSVVTSTRSPRSARWLICAEQVGHLPAGRRDLDLRIHQPRRADDLLDHLAAALLQLVRPRRGARRTAPGSTSPRIPRTAAAGCPGADGSRKPCSTSTSLRLRSPSNIARICGMRHVRLVDDQQEILGEVVDQRVRLGPGGRPARCRE